MFALRPVADELNAGLGDLKGLSTPKVQEGATHVYYVYGMVLDTDELGVERKAIFDALKAEGVPGLMPGYQTIHRLPIFTEQCAYGTGSFPWSLREGEGRNFAYGTGTCPVAEELHERRVLSRGGCHPRCAGAVLPPPSATL